MITFRFILLQAADYAAQLAAVFGAAAASAERGAAAEQLLEVRTMYQWGW